MDTPVVRRALEVLNVMTQNDRERELYEGRLKARRDMAAHREGGREEGIKEGIKEGREQERKEAAIHRIRVYRQLLKDSPFSEEQLRATPLDELVRLADELEQSVLRPQA
jgi:ribosomal protein L19E